LAFNLSRLGALILSLNKIDLPKLSDKDPVKGDKINNIAYILNIQNSRIYQTFQELLVILTQRNATSEQVTLLPQEQPNLAQPNNGIITFDQTLRRFQASEDTRKYFDAFPREGCRLTNNAPVAIPNNALTAVAFPFERYDPYNMHNTVVNNSRINILRTGNYVVGGCIEYAAAVAGSRKIFVRKNGTTNVVGNSTLSLGAEDTVISTECIYQFTVNDYIELIAFQNSGGPINANAAGDYTPEFWCGRIHNQPV